MRHREYRISPWEVAKRRLELLSTPPVETIANSKVLLEDSPRVANERRVIGGHLARTGRFLGIIATVSAGAVFFEGVSDVGLTSAALPVIGYGIGHAVDNYIAAAWHSENLVRMEEAVTWTTEPLAVPHPPVNP